ncbi:hypothetical protein L1049_007872 [Liquidambar formosana]|uniref:t-SNARE coiled-coil homology domain-containing protein n=1 Tax=Liquidambar formosana TaxID=63359 RepID=A0AAP0S2L7_LIQFO
MNDLFSNSSSGVRSEDHHVIQMTSLPSTGGEGGDGGVVNLDNFFQEVESIKDELNDIENIRRKLMDYHEQSKTLHNANSIKDLRTRMDSDVTLALKKAKLVKTRLQALNKSNAAHRSLPGCGPGSSSDRTRTSVVNGLIKKLQDSMNSFNAMRQKISAEYRDTVQRRYFTVTGQNPDETTIDALISTGESENFLRKAILEQGRGVVLDTIYEIQERHEGVKEMEKNLKELHQVFLDVAVLVQTQGEQLDDIESHVARASSFVRDGTQQLQKARSYQKNTRKWSCYAIILLVIILIVLLVILKIAGII